VSWHPNDLVTDTDLLAYERQILTQFQQTDWASRRQKAIEDWLFPLLETQGFDPLRFRTRHQPVTLFGYTSSAYTDRTTAAGTADGVNLATVLAGSSDAIYIGFDRPFRGISVRMRDSVSSVTGALSVGIWTDAWQTPAELVDGTRAGVKTFAKGGAITWRLPEDIVRRSLNNSDPLYWAKVQTSTAPTGALAGPWAVILRSRLAAATAFRTLALIYREAPAGQDGPWTEKAEWYERQADQAFQRAVALIGPEVDTDDSDAIDEAEREQTSAEVSGGGWTLERG